MVQEFFAHINNNDNMDGALQRCYRAVPLTHVRDLAPARGVVALRCVRTGCTACADFETDGRLAFEERLTSEHSSHVNIRRWNCDDTDMRKLAVAAGATDIPVYLLISSKGDVEVRHVS